MNKKDEFKPLNLDLGVPVFIRNGKADIVDPVVVHRDDLDSKSAETLKNPWALILPSGIVLGFKKERSAEFARRWHRDQLGLDPWNGKPINRGE